jgi:lipopolysaccharide/colanic/teichoic acid biosynthesis glycosyltransferase
MRSPWSPARRASKRAFDLAASTLGLLLLALPLLLLGLCVRLSSPGPALFRQWRVGRNGRRFRILKLRTMVVDASAQGPAVTADGDPRVTPLGRLLRRTKLDELPQLVNVWLGDMSLVGPRPEVPRYLPLYSLTDRLVVLSVRPGITDPASLRLRNEEQLLARFADRERAYAEVLLPLKLDLARDYVAGQSFSGDLALIIKTLARLA